MNYFKTLLTVIFFISINNPNIFSQTPSNDTTYINFHKVDKAWKYSKGDNVKIAILDWLFDMSPEAAKKYVDPISLVPGQPLGELKPWHGAWMAEIVNNIAPKAKIIPIRARPKSKKSDNNSPVDRPYEKYIIEGIKYAADHDAAAVTSSMGPLRQTPELTDAINYAKKKGTVFIDVHPEYKDFKNGKVVFCDSTELNPLIIHPGIVSVPAHPYTKKAEMWRDFYTWPYDIDPVFRDGWGFSNGPPIVAGIVALMKSVNPKLSVEEIKNILIKTSEPENGFNVIDAEAAVKRAIELNK